MNNKQKKPETDIGKIIMNLQSLEVALRLFLDESVGPPDHNLHFEQLTQGDKVSKSPLTNYDTLRQVMKKFNKRLEALGVSKRVDESLVDVRDALAHGRVLGFQPKGPLRLFKFAKPDRKSGKVEVATVVDLTPEWLDLQVRRTFDEIFKVVQIGKDLGLKCFSDSPSRSDGL